MAKGQLLQPGMRQTCLSGPAGYPPALLLALAGRCRSASFLRVAHARDGQGEAELSSAGSVVPPKFKQDAEGSCVQGRVPPETGSGEKVFLFNH